MLSDFKNESVFDSFDFESVEDGRNLSFELNVHDGTNDLDSKLDTCEIWPFLAAALTAVLKLLFKKLPTNMNKIILNALQ
jgi:hypothetical protein